MSPDSFEDDQADPNLPLIRCLMYSPTSTGGHPVYVRELAHALENQGVQVTHLTSEDIDERNLPTVTETAPVLKSLQPRANYTSRTIWAVSRVAHYFARELQFGIWTFRNRDRFDIVHLQEVTSWMLPIIIWMLHKIGLPCVLTLHNVEPHSSNSRLVVINERISPRALNRCDAIYLHEGIDLHGVASRGIDVSKVVEVSIGVSGEVSDYNPLGKIALLFGVLRSNKGVPLFLTLAQHRPDWTFVVAGRVEDEEVEEALRHRSANVVVQLGYVNDDEVDRLFGSATCVVLPYTQFEAQSHVLHLAIGHGRPVIVNDVGAMASVVRQFGCGFVNAEGTWRGLSDQLDRFDEEDGRSRVLSGVRTARDELSWDSAAAKTAASYRQVVADYRWRHCGA